MKSLLARITALLFRAYSAVYEASAPPASTLALASPKAPKIPEAPTACVFLVDRVTRSVTLLPHKSVAWCDMGSLLGDAYILTHSEEAETNFTPDYVPSGVWS